MIVHLLRRAALLDLPSFMITTRSATSSASSWSWVTNTLVITSRRRARSGRSSCSRSPARTGAATRSGRCSSGSTARSGRPRRSSTVPVAARGGEEARPPPARRPARPVQLPRRLPGLGVLAPEGPADLADARGRDARAAGPPRLPGGLHARSSSTRSCGSSPATGTSTAKHVPASSPRTRRSASSR